MSITKIGNISFYHIFYFLLSVIFFTFGMKNVLFYSSWAAGFIIIVASLFYFIYMQGVATKIIKIFVVQASWVFWTLLLTPYATDTSVHLQYIAVTLFYIAVSVFSMFFILKSKNEFLNALFWFIAVLVLVNLLFLILYGAGLKAYERGFSGIFYNRNRFAIATTFLSFVLYYFRGEFGGRKRLVSTGLILLSLVLIVVTLSIKGMLGVVMFLFYYLSSNKSRLLRYFMILVSGLIVILTLSTENPVKERLFKYKGLLTASYELKPGDSAFVRYYFILESVDIISKNMIKGIGVNNSRFYLLSSRNIEHMFQGEEKDKTLKGTYSHNNYLEMLLNGGIPAFLLYYLPLLIALVYVYRNRRKDSLTDLAFIFVLYKLVLGFAVVEYFDMVFVFITSLCYFAYAAIPSANARTDG